mgnify:CR=1 FL=1
MDEFEVPGSVTETVEVGTPEAPRQAAVTNVMFCHNPVACLGRRFQSLPDRRTGERARTVKMCQKCGTIMERISRSSRGGMIWKVIPTTLAEYNETINRQIAAAKAAATPPDQDMGDR